MAKRRSYQYSCISTEWPKWHVKDYGYRSQGKELPQLRLKLLMNITGVLAQQKAKEAENMSKRSQNSQNELRQEATATLIPKGRPASKLQLVQNCHAP